MCFSYLHKCCAHSAAQKAKIHPKKKQCESLLQQATPPAVPLPAAPTPSPAVPAAALTTVKSINYELWHYICPCPLPQPLPSIG